MQYPDIDRRIRETYVKPKARPKRRKQYDMYKRFIRWASDRLADDGIIAFITNRALPGLPGRMTGFAKSSPMNSTTFMGA